MITDFRDLAQTAESAELMAVFKELFTSEPGYRTIWELGFGINTNMEISPANCGLNETYGAANGVIHIGLGLTPFTKFALTFICPSSSLVDSAGGLLLGSRGARAPGSRRINRIRSANCGCH